MELLKKRRDFLRLQKGRRAHTGLFSVQAAPHEGAQASSRVGFTVSKRVSPLAVKRNRIRRRLKAAMRLAALPEGMDFVVVARIEALRAPFDRLASTLDAALRKAAGPRNDTTSAAGRAADPKAT